MERRGIHVERVVVPLPSRLVQDSANNGYIGLDGQLAGVYFDIFGNLMPGDTAAGALSRKGIYGRPGSGCWSRRPIHTDEPLQGQLQQCRGEGTVWRPKDPNSIQVLQRALGGKETVLFAVLFEGLFEVLFDIFVILF